MGTANRVEGLTNHWPKWCDMIAQVAKLEAVARPLMKKLLASYDNMPEEIIHESGKI